MEKESDALAGCLLYLCNYPRGHPKQELEAAVKRLGGVVSANFLPKVTHVLAGGERALSVCMETKTGQEPDLPERGCASGM